jgi:hypothetical protein
MTIPSKRLPIASLRRPSVALPPETMLADGLRVR